ncbi:MAG: hypothetical protein JF612_14900, partial [Planctomycetia bacterium]|nr:hypothetical protein [Planctomycetia bacterium]
MATIGGVHGRGIMAKQMSVEEILAAARAEKAKGAGAPTSGGEAKATPSAEETGDRGQGTELGEPAAAANVPPAGKVAPGGKGMSMAEILAAAKAKPGAAPAKPAAAKPAAAKPAAAKPAAGAPAAKAAAAKPAAAKDGGTTAAPKDTASVLAAVRKGAKPGPMTKAEALA